MKLELKHLAPYLPYRLNTRYFLSDVIVLNEGQPEDTRDKLLTSDNVKFVLSYCKPILRPLSDYEDLNGKAMIELNCDLTDQFDIQELAAQTQSLNMTTYGAMEIMFENHIDVFGLITGGLAIDVNTLK